MSSICRPTSWKWYYSLFKKLKTNIEWPNSWRWKIKKKKKQPTTKNTPKVSANSYTDTKSYIWEKEFRQSRTAKCCVESNIFLFHERSTLAGETDQRDVSFSSVRTLQNCQGCEKAKLSDSFHFPVIFKGKPDLLNLLVSHNSYSHAQL